MNFSLDFKSVNLLNHHSKYLGEVQRKSTLSDFGIYFVREALERKVSNIEVVGHFTTHCRFYFQVYLEIIRLRAIFSWGCSTGKGLNIFIGESVSD